MEITSHQLRAARGIVGLTVIELAAAAGVSRFVIDGYESEQTRPRKSSMDALCATLERMGVEFLGLRGVAKRDDIVTIFEGADFYVRFIDHMTHYMKGQGAALFTNIDDSLSTPETVDANVRLRTSGVKCRYLCRERPTRLDYARDDYRALPAAHFRNGVQVIFADCIATLARGQLVLVVRNQDAADGARQVFEVVWSNLQIPVLADAR
ncbi:MAG: helix-turn-helix transcriptional regulator [Alphaproteobacteria bacterium]